MPDVSPKANTARILVRVTPAPEAGGCHSNVQPGDRTPAGSWAEPCTSSVTSTLPPGWSTAAVGDDCAVASAAAAAAASLSDALRWACVDSCLNTASAAATAASHSFRMSLLFLCTRFLRKQSHGVNRRR